MERRRLTLAGIKNLLIQAAGTVPEALARDAARIREAETRRVKLTAEKRWNPRMWYRAHRLNDRMVIMPLSRRQYMVMQNKDGVDAGYLRIPRKVKGKAAVKAHKRARHAA